VNLAGAIGAAALLDIHGGQAPDDEQNHDLARSFVEMNEWADFDETTAYTYLSAVSDQRDVWEVLPPETVARLVFVMGAWLLGAFGPAGRKWYQYLDQIEKAIESA
jgi:hypothetical protein